ncbi:GntR family transcriptional regulator [Mongoliimonas terrestris]|uniref:GntR family transcriptional regulator n=1 Tax=Mongoliimonas terrestris TaxID=1709001 RepID=UPI0009FAF6F5|nr:GntR family transcriptional regulator [Mongoliimonas terrestris]
MKTGAKTGATGAVGAGPDAGERPEAHARTGVRDRVTEALRAALIIGRIQPGRPMTLRGLADELGTSPMPVREAIRGLAAERALDISDNGRIQVPRMTEQRFAEILKARALLEPAAAMLALPNLDRKDAPRRLRALDDQVDASLRDGNVEAYMRHNHAFHFALYEASRSDVFLPLIESVWLRFGPFMRIVYGRVGTAGLVDHHKAAVAAVAAGDAEALGEAIRLDIAEGMALIREALVAGAADFAGPR